MLQQPGWMNVPGKGMRYWNGKNFQFYGPSDSAGTRGQNRVNLDIAGMYNNFVDEFGSTTSDPSKVGQQPYQQYGYDSREAYLSALKKRREALDKDKPETTVDTVPAAVSQSPDTRLGNVETPTPYPTEAVMVPVKKKPPEDPETPTVVIATGLDTASGSREARLDPNATERYAANFKAGQANMDQIQDMYSGETKYKDTGKTDLQLWAAANPALAQKEFAKAESKALEPGGALYGYDTMDTFKPSELKDLYNIDALNPIDQATALGGNLTIDAQTFADKKVGNVIDNLKNGDLANISLSDMQNLNIPDNLFLKDSDGKALIDKLSSYSPSETGPLLTDIAYTNPYKDFGVMDEIPRIVGMPGPGFLQGR